ncbi:uncharacterized protein BJ212DRAFT_1349750 [Suillus subaureus]|uniref:Uncharacterized protein n=1 Tax=Suillus subaureus TaxID=48587 RepID=A0A9P7EC26_9AGAM|nr:uncharacterized protein BJ212DRAFT_1349750 [Suillus subaureus]KAG1817532.1 hypothetical protein BJ212DRAFT_1349750 [Suillus subaureus]
MVKDIVPELASPIPSCLDVDAIANPQSGGHGFTDGERDDLHGDFSRTYHPYHPLASSAGPSRRSRNHNLSSTWRFWNITIPSRRHSPENESTPLQQRPKHSLFAGHTDPQPVTISAGRKQNSIHVARPPVKTNAQTGQSSSMTARPAVPPVSIPQPQSQVQTTTQQPAPEEDYGFWGNFCLALGCIRRTRRAVSTAQSAAS